MPLSRSILPPLVLSLLLGAAARGQPLPTPVEEVVAASRQSSTAEEDRHFKAGVDFFGKEKVDAALAEFEAAWALRPAPDTLYNIALSHRKLLHYPEAIAAFKQFLEMDHDGPEARRNKAAEILAKLLSRVVEIQLADLPDGARVTVDGRSLGAAPLGGIPLPPGHHSILVNAAGYLPGELEISVVQGMDPIVRVPLSEIRRAAMVRIRCNVIGAMVHIDGNVAGLTPLALELPSGGHSLEVSAPGYQTHRGELAVEAGQEREVEILLEKTPPPIPAYKKGWVWGLVGTGAAGVAAAVLIPMFLQPTAPPCDRFALGCDPLQ